MIWQAPEHLRTSNATSSLHSRGFAPRMAFDRIIPQRCDVILTRVRMGKIACGACVFPTFRHIRLHVKGIDNVRHSSQCTYTPALAGAHVPISSVDLSIRCERVRAFTTCTTAGALRKSARANG